MGLFTEEQLINRFNASLINKGVSDSYRAQLKAIEFLNESVAKQKYFSAYSAKTYDIFLSHSSNDARQVYGLKLELEDRGYSVYVDWIDDRDTDRSKVTKTNAEMLRSRMKQCKSLLYAFSKNASRSTWMPWELGYFDGIKGLVAVAPISKEGNTSYSGNEYLGLYPYIDIALQENGGGQRVWVNEYSDTYVLFTEWLQGKKPYKRPI